ncbi:MAG TPA: limonene-1,2-epoxide hydrolase family protein [Myxococcota bacterium]|nr:limonene-1,2-epoxide hydrolase family protein [Myxococcota bacterium]
MNPTQIVTDFFDAVPRRNVEELVGFFSDDAVYHNIPIAPVKGRDAIAATLRGFLDPSTEAEFEVLSLAASANKVLTERIDRFTINGKKIALPVMGTFEVDTRGKISAWRDYFDLAQFTKQIA